MNLQVNRYRCAVSGNDETGYDFFSWSLLQGVRHAGLQPTNRAAEGDLRIYPRQDRDARLRADSAGNRHRVRDQIAQWRHVSPQGPGKEGPDQARGLLGPGHSADRSPPA